MPNLKAIVTIVIGNEYSVNWKKYCEASWRRYADGYGFDLIVLGEPLDTSERARSRSVSWQKCLILSTEFAARYDKIVWVDSDIIFNDSCSPDITSGVPPEKIGVVEDLQFSHLAFIHRAFRLWPEGDAVINYTVKEYYTQYGLPGDVDRLFNAGVLVLSPKFHQPILEHVYYDYEEKEGGRKWHMEQRPLAYEVLKSAMAHWLDPRFNILLWYEEYANYPFLQLAPSLSVRGPNRVLSRIDRKLRKILRDVEYSSRHNLRVEMVNAIFQGSYFLHFASRIDEMPFLRDRPTAWWDVLQPTT